MSGDTTVSNTAFLACFDAALQHEHIKNVANADRYDVSVGIDAGPGTFFD